MSFGKWRNFQITNISVFFFNYNVIVVARSLLERWIWRHGPTGVTARSPAYARRPGLLETFWKCKLSVWYTENSMIFLKRKSSIFSSAHNTDLPNVDVNTTPSLISDVNTISRKNTVRLTTYWTVTKIPYDHQINVAFKNQESFFNVIF